MTLRNQQGSALCAVIFLMGFCVLYLTHYWFCYTLLFNAAHSHVRLENSRQFLKVAGQKLITSLVDQLDFESNKDLGDQRFEMDTHFFKPGSVVRAHITNDSKLRQDYLCTVQLISGNETFTNSYKLRHRSGCITVKPISLS